jgi:glutamate-ammonia-ligase adenylyltransferase
VIHLIPELTSYSQAELHSLKTKSPAFERYLGLEQRESLEPGTDLRKRRNQAWLRAVAATFYGTASTLEVCQFWSNTADLILTEAWRQAQLEHEPAALFALGKLGAHELNISSDVDLLIVGNTPSLPEIERKVRSFRKLISEVTEFGFCFRVDFDLRPGGQSSQIVTTPLKFQDHYWSRGEAWEKMALVRLRALCGNQEFIDPVIEQAHLFSYRKFLDFNLLEDLGQVRARIHQEGFDPRPQEIHIKLERGGIRDIELFVNALQVLHGGKITRLQTPSTNVAFNQIRALKILPENEINILQKTYWEFREWENLTQAIDDRQTHFLFWPNPWNGPSRDETVIRMKRIDEIVTGLLGSAERTSDPEVPLEADQATWLKALGFNQHSVGEVWPTLITATALSQKTDRDERARRKFLFKMIQALSKTTNDRDLGLALLCDFIKATRAKAAFFALLNREPRLVDDLARLFSFSPYLGSLLSSRPELIDNFVLNVGEPFSADFEIMLDEMAERKFLSEFMGSIRFLSDLDTSALVDALTFTADEVTSHLLERLVSELDSQKMDLLCLGKWGGRELGLKSDLDFIFICEDIPTENEHKVARRFISRLTDPYRGGSLYEIDLRLRPSGKAGPILTTRAKLKSYLEEDAEIWERQAYLRGRFLETSQKLDVNLFLKPVSRDDLIKLGEIRVQLLRPMTDDFIDLKYSPGGLVDVEFAAQATILQLQFSNYSFNSYQSLKLLIAGPWLGAENLATNYYYLRSIEQLLGLAGRANELRLGHETLHRVASFRGLSDQACFAEVQEKLRENSALLAKLDPRQNSISSK